jgi:hypothetical protein
VVASHPAAVQSFQSIREYFDLYLTEGIEALSQLNYQGQPNLLQKKKDEIITFLEAQPPATLKQAQVKIKEVSGLERSLPQISEFSFLVSPSKVRLT